MPRVLLVDDHRMIRDSFRELFDRMPGYELVGSIASADLAEAFCARLRPDLIVMDVCTEGNISGLTAAATLRRRFPKLKIIIMSGFDEISYSARAKQVGASAFVSKSAGLDEFESVIRTVTGGGEHFAESERDLPEILSLLTDRERQILRLLCEHKSRREIARELYLSEMTVKRHVANMLAKTGFADSVELAFYMITNGWINPRY